MEADEDEQEQPPPTKLPDASPDVEPVPRGLSLRELTKAAAPEGEDSTSMIEKGSVELAPSQDPNAALMRSLARRRTPAPAPQRVAEQSIVDEVSSFCFRLAPSTAKKLLDDMLLFQGILQ